MKRFDQTSASCQIFTYKEGLLSVLAHDLRINVTSFVVELGDDDTLIDASFDAGSLHVDCAMVDGLERRDLLSEASMKEIDENILKDVLDAATYRFITFSSGSVTKEDSAYLIKGSLTLHGISREITLTARNEGNYYVAEARLDLPEFGIKPFSALFGAIRIKPGIFIRTALPLGIDNRPSLEPLHKYYDIGKRKI
jgi:hypothetical protein